MQTLDHHHSPHQQHSLSESDDQYSSSLVLSYNDENEHDVDKSNSEGDQDDVSDLSSIVAPIQPVNRSSWTIEDMRNLLSSNRRHSQDGGSIKLLQSLKPNTTPGLRSIFQTVFDNKFGTIGVNNNNNNKIARSSSVATILNPCLNEKHEDSLIFAGPIISISEYMAKSGLGKLLSRKSKKIGINTRKSLVLLEISTACIREYELVKNGKKGDLLCEIQTQFMGFGLKRKRGNASTINNNNNNCNSLNLDNNINHTATTSPTSSNHLFSRSRPNSTGSSSLATCTEERRHSSGNEYASTDKQKLMFVLKDNSSDAGVERIYEVYSYSELHIWYSRLKVAQTGGYKNGVELNYATTTTTTTSKASPSIIHPYSFKKLDRLESDRTITSPLSQSSSNSLIIATAYPPSLQEISKELNAARKLNSRHFDLLEAATETLRKQVYGMQTSNQKSKFKIDRLLDRNERLIEILEERRFKLVNNNHA